MAFVLGLKIVNKIEKQRASEIEKQRLIKRGYVLTIPNGWISFPTFWA